MKHSTKETSPHRTCPLPGSLGAGYNSIAPDLLRGSVQERTSNDGVNKNDILSHHPVTTATATVDLGTMPGCFSPLNKITSSTAMTTSLANGVANAPGDMEIEENSPLKHKQLFPGDFGPPLLTTEQIQCNLVLLSHEYAAKENNTIKLTEEVVQLRGQFRKNDRENETENERPRNELRVGSALILIRLFQPP